ncbi:flagellar basal body FlgE domain-containing protein [Pleionea sp. CnH1-48]|uniref:flagellar basal body FlgE domain-containing protein n=1 Tax=Pleionea sp. CnH1-48 TaxID=2954494 RepID=UPI002098676F|nr:hypothetical protein [Pleionea sp. CnH1-48]MCO7224249.1 hypothetical protein [Pleionea sp. CnH1-48]
MSPIKYCLIFLLTIALAACRIIITNDEDYFRQCTLELSVDLPAGAERHAMSQFNSAVPSSYNFSVAADLPVDNGQTPVTLYFLKQSSTQWALFFGTNSYPADIQNSDIISGNGQYGAQLTFNTNGTLNNQSPRVISSDKMTSNNSTEYFFEFEALFDSRIHSGALAINLFHRDCRDS